MPGPRKHPTMIEFLAKMKRTRQPGCWIMPGSRDKDGYVCYDENAKRERAHRVAFRITTGINPGKLSVCHKCDNPPCCRPSHLFSGTNIDNMKDCARKGRKKGERHPNAKLTDRQVRKIRKDRRILRVIAKDHGIKLQTACNVRNRKSWTHVR